MKKDTIEINAVLDKEIATILQNTKYYEDFLSGKFICQCCNQVITEKNIGVIIPIQDENDIHLEFYCDNINCIDKYYTTNK